MQSIGRELRARSPRRILSARSKIAWGRRMSGEAPESGTGPPPTDPPAAGQVLNASIHVFISYASQDVAVARALVEALERHGVRCWIAPRDVKAGAQYADAIVRAISGAKAFVLVLSESAIASSHVGREIERASSKKRPIIALRIDAAPLTPALEYFLSESQWVEAQTGSMEAAYAKLIDDIRDPARTAPETLVAVAPGKSPGTASAAHPKSGRNRILLAAGLAVVAALAAMLADKFWLAKHVASEQTKIAATNVVSDKSIAVLPFVDLSEKKDQEYFANGIAEEVLDRLAKVPGLRVVGRTSSFQFKGKNTDSASIGAALGVAYLLEGSVRRDAGRVRVAAQLMDAQTGSQRWSDRFDSDVIDVLHVQDTIAAEIARALQIAVEVDAAPRSSVKSPEALDAYLRGRQSLDRSTQEGCEAAVADFQKALTLDSTFAPAAIGLARAYVYIGSLGWLPTRVAFERAREAALLGQRLDPQSPSPHVLMAEIHTHYDWDWVGADQELQRAFALGPRETYGVKTAARLAAARGHWDEARQLAIEAIELDPLDAEAYGNLGFEIHLRSGHLAEAEQSLRRALQIAPGWGSGHYFLGVALMLQGQRDAALAEFQKETLEDGRLEGSAMIHFLVGRKAESDAQLAAAIRQSAASWPSEIARVYAFRREPDHAFEWLNRAYEVRDEDLYFIKGDPLLKNLETDPRYKAFLRKMNLPE
jgi:TolB-like protein/Flp pilus assembly protein TadD